MSGRQERERGGEGREGCCRRRCWPCTILSGVRVVVVGGAQSCVRGADDLARMLLMVTANVLHLTCTSHMALFQRRPHRESRERDARVRVAASSQHAHSSLAYFDASQTPAKQTSATALCRGNTAHHREAPSLAHAETTRPTQSRLCGGEGAGGKQRAASGTGCSRQHAHAACSLPTATGQHQQLCFCCFLFSCCLLTRAKSCAAIIIVITQQPWIREHTTRASVHDDTPHGHSTAEGYDQAILTHASLYGGGESRKGHRKNTHTPPLAAADDER